MAADSDLLKIIYKKNLISFMYRKNDIKPYPINCYQITKQYFVFHIQIILHRSIHNQKSIFSNKYKLQNKQIYSHILHGLNAK